MNNPVSEHRYIPQPCGCYHQHYRPKRGKWKVLACTACERPLEHYLQQDGSYAVHHQCDKVVAERPPSSIFIGEPQEGDLRTYSERLGDGAKVLGQADEDESREQELEEGYDGT